MNKSFKIFLDQSQSNSLYSTSLKVTRPTVRYPTCLRTEIDSNAISLGARHPNSDARIKITTQLVDNTASSSPYDKFTAQTLSIDCAIIPIYFLLYTTRSALASRLSSFISKTTAAVLAPPFAPMILDYRNTLHHASCYSVGVGPRRFLPHLQNSCSI